MIRPAMWPLVPIAMLVSSPAWAEWFRIGSSVDGSVWFMDPARLKTVAGKRQAWVQIDHSKDRTIPWRKSLRLLSFDCESEKYRMLSYVNYDSYGKIIASQNFSDYGSSVGYDPIVPESMAETVSQVACYVATEPSE